MTRLRLNEKELLDGINLTRHQGTGNCWGNLGILPGYQIGAGPIVANPDIRPMLVKLSLDKPQFITVYTRSPLNDDVVAGWAGFPTEEIVGHIQYGVGGYACDADFDWLEGNRLTVCAQSLQVTARRINLGGAVPGANPGDYQVAAFASPGTHGTTEITRTVTYFGAAVVPGANCWAAPIVIPRMSKNLAVHVPANPTTVFVAFFNRSLVACGGLNINIPYVDDIRIPNGAKFFQVGNVGAVNTPVCMTFIFGLVL